MRNVVLAGCLSLLRVFAPNDSYGLDLYAVGSYWQVEDGDGVAGVGVGASLPLIIEALRLDGRAYFFENSDYGRDEELELLPIDLGLQVHLRPGETIDPYLLGGVSWIQADADRYDIDPAFGTYVGAGLEYGLNETFRLFGEAVYRMAELDSDSRFGSRDEIEVSGMTGNAGLKLHF